MIFLFFYTLSLSRNISNYITMASLLIIFTYCIRKRRQTDFTWIMEIEEEERPRRNERLLLNTRRKLRN
jgi:hypothetical protein